ncbi:AraC family transcriptional regulator [Nocardia rhamnosiphila]|uniref:AraC family transcriptional regulator n=1 Tax=Nocardia rhamnosiphila TaxID=426716 RepID=A0ABV2WRA3_9NOCA
MDPEYQWATDLAADSETGADRMERWDYYLRSRQGPFGLRFGADSAEFEWSAIAQQLGERQIVRFDTGPVDYSRSENEVQSDRADHRLMMPKSGGFKIAQGDSAEIVGPNEIAFVHWRMPVRLLHKEPLDALIMTVPEEAIDPDRAKNAPLALDMRKPLMRSLVNRLSELHDSYEDWVAEDYTVAYDSALDLLNWALNPPRPEVPRDHAYVAATAREFMERHADNRRLTPDAVAVHCEVSKRTLHTALTDTLGLAPAELLRKIRLDRARKRLVRHGLGHMQRVARLAGYSRPSGFREAFTRQYGHPPEELFG